MEDRTLLSTSIPLSTSAWISIGPAPIQNGQVPGGGPVSGRIAALAADPTDPNTIYIAAAGGGVWKTTDAGSSWTPLTDDQPTLTMGAIAVAPSDPEVVYAGTGEANGAIDSYFGRGVLKSTNAGATWSLLGTAQFDRHTISKLVVDPTDPETVYVAVAGGGTDGVGGNTGIWKSTDGGTTWSDTTTRISTSAAFMDLVEDPSDPRTLFAAVGSTGGAAANGVYKTADGGATWARAGDFPAGTADGRIALAIAATDPQTVYASIAGSGQGGTTSGHLFKMMKTTDGGGDWAELTSTPNYLGSQGWYDTTLAVDPTDADIVYAGGQGGGTGVIESRDGGLTWVPIGTGVGGNNGPHADHHGIGFDANGRLLDGNDGGIWRLDDPVPGEVHWSNLVANLAITTFVGIALDPTNPDIAYGGSQDNGTEKFDDSPAWTERRGGDGGIVRVDPSNPSTVYHAYTGASLERSDNGGATWSAKTSGINTSDPANFYVPYVLDPANPSRLLLGTNRVYETTDRGDHWSPISTPNANGWGSSAAIDTLAAAPTDADTIYASAGGRIFVTTDHGVTWVEHDLPGSLLKVQDLKVDPTDSRIAYTVRSGVATHQGHVFRTNDGGVTWTDISGNLPDLTTRAFVLNKGSGPDDVYFISNDDGVYISTDQGSSWSRAGSGLPNVRVRSLDLAPTLGILAAGTYGRGMWELSVAPVADHISVGAPTGVTAGSPFDVTVTVLDQFNHVFTNSTGTVTFTSTDPGATLPDTYNFTAADQGTHTFAGGITLVTAGPQTITVTDSDNGTISASAPVAVTWATADHISVSAPGEATSSVAFDLSVIVQDAYNNTVADYTGTVTFSSTDSDPGVVLPGDYTFSPSDGGMFSFSGGATLITPGDQTISATDTATGSITGGAVITVDSGSVPAEPRSGVTAVAPGMIPPRLAAVTGKARVTTSTKAGIPSLVPGRVDWVIEKARQVVLNISSDWWLDGRRRSPTRL